MSVNHNYTIANDGATELRANIAGLDVANRSIDELTAHVYATCAITGNPKFTCTLTIPQLAGLHTFLGQYDMIKDVAKGQSGEFIQVKKGQEEIIQLLVQSDHAQVLPALKTIIKDSLSEDDINIILGRKDAIVEFENWLLDPGSHTEPEWQSFLERNGWIFGYGLRYKYLSILQRECRISGTDLDGGNSIITDFLMSDNRFTKLVELKKPNTPLFKFAKNRSESWQLSVELTDAVSQILCQKASWELKSQTACFDSTGARITEASCDVDCILLIGTSNQFAGDNKEAEIKRRTIELYRRNMRNLEILFYDELLERARFIVRGLNESSNMACADSPATS